MVNKSKKILFLGGASSQMPAIAYASKMSYHVITVDYTPTNPGHAISNEYFNISTVEKKKILKLSQKLNIDAISAYASDPAAETAAYVSEKLGLIGGAYEPVRTLSDKKRFRNFLKNNNYNVPWFISSSRCNSLIKGYNGEKAILKPVDSSGSKGVFLINDYHEINKVFEECKSFSRTGRVILEKYIERKGPQIHGEGFVVNGELLFILLGDQVFSPVSPLVPYSTIVPSIYHSDIMDKLIKIVDVIVKNIGFKTGGINVEIIRDKNDKIYVLEIGARNGGNYMPQLMFYASDINLAKINVDALLNKNFQIKKYAEPKKYFAQVILHSSKKGTFKGIDIPETFKKSVLEKNLYFRIGDEINSYKSSKDVVGVIILEFGKKIINNYFTAINSHNWVIVD
jgi:biotin carboxylase